MRVLLAGAVLVAVLGMGFLGCSSNAPQLDTNSTLRYDSARDGVPKDMGGPPTKGGGKGKSKGGGAAPP
jgi:hypothetical protein